jgi:hypothetical protein
MRIDLFLFPENTLRLALPAATATYARSLKKAISTALGNLWHPSNMHVKPQKTTQGEGLID